MCMRHLNSNYMQVLAKFVSDDWRSISDSSGFSEIGAVDFLASKGLLQRNESVMPLIFELPGINGTIEQQRIDRALITTHGDARHRRPILYRLTKRGQRQIATNSRLTPQ